MKIQLALACVVATVLASSARADLTLRGQFLYKDRPYDSSPQGWTGADVELPIRFAKVQVVEDGNSTIYAEGSTDENGTVNLVVPTGGLITFRVVCYSRVADGTFGPKTIRVTDASAPPVEYSVATDVIFAPDPNAEIVFGTVVAQELLLFPNNPPMSQYLGNPFNMLDQLVWSVQYAMARGAPEPTRNMFIRWPDPSGTNAPINGDAVGVALHYGGGDCDPIILHELGHGLQAMYSSILLSGTPHFLYQNNQQPMEAFREGWAHFIAGAVQSYRGDAGPFSFLAISPAVEASGGIFRILILRLEDGYPYTPVHVAGEASESAIGCALWDIGDTSLTNDGDGGIDDDLVDSVPFAGGASGEEVLWETLMGPFHSVPYTTIDELWNGMFVPVHHGNFRAVKLAFDGWGMRFYKDADEPNDASAQATALALGAWTPIHTLYTSSSIPAVPGNGDLDFFAFDLTAGQDAEVETRYPNGATDARTLCDPFLTVRAPDGSTVGATGTGGFDRNAKLAFTAALSGTYTAEVRAVTSNPPPLLMRKVGSYEVRAQVVP